MYSKFIALKKNDNSIGGFYFKYVKLLLKYLSRLFDENK
jgi:hypothetical protein